MDLRKYNKQYAVGVESTVMDYTLNINRALKKKLKAAQRNRTAWTFHASCSIQIEKSNCQLLFIDSSLRLFSYRFLWATLLPVVEMGVSRRWEG
jgi:hypothetical protein